jgi:hypothetical protein
MNPYGLGGLSDNLLDRFRLCYRCRGRLRLCYRYSLSLIIVFSIGSITT